ncbi:MAG: hypothetical protein JST47_12540 [Bacteroidetes bacterium]|nr:hypothetical protein [Bacteroidota bacterium]MBS1974388.1 hypothetical protein [Bacteroidota bacterium]
MAYSIDHFESQKNTKASLYTLGICTALVLLFVFITWTLPAPPVSLQEDGIEVNLGNSDQGLGTNQPYLPGKPSAEDKQKYTPPKTAAVEKQAVKEVETDDNNKEEAPVVKRPPVTKPEATKIIQKDITPKVVKATPKPAENPAPPKPRPKAVFNGVNGTGNGGNDADSYKAGGNQGIAGGRGDQGRPGGNPNSDNYTGNGGTGHSGVTISKGLQGRKIVGTPSFTDDFNENAKVAVDVHVDAGGNVTSADYQLRGSTTSEGSMVAIALRKAKQIKFNAGGSESVGTLIFNFKVHD